MCGLLVASPAIAQTTIYADDFSGDSATDLNGLAPDTAPDSETWASSTTASAWKADGSIAGNAGSTWRNAFLPFAPENNKAYTLSLDVDLDVVGDWDGWMAMGFAEYGETEDSFAGNGPSPWMFRNYPDSTHSYVEMYLLGTMDKTWVQTTLTTVNMQIVLDTGPVLWTAEWFVNGTSERGPVALSTTANPAIAYVGFGQRSTASGNVDNFELTVANPTLPGDADGDGDVDADDAATLAANWLTGPDATWFLGDFNDDGYVNDIDATMLATNWTGAMASVPEPGVFVLLAGAMLLLIIRRR